MASFTPRPLYSGGMSRLYSLDRKLGGPQSRPGRYREEKNLALPRIELRPPAYGLYRQSSPDSRYYHCWEIISEVLKISIFECRRTTILSRYYLKGSDIFFEFLFISLLVFQSFFVLFHPSIFHPFVHSSIHHLCFNIY
jgi:hypothetical protein